jgi:solute carrier family 25 carnitine/acylcarnitine transporter 20/29
MIAGMFAGFVNSLVLSPIELVKCRLQLQEESKNKAYYKGSMDCVRKIIRDEGVRNGLFKGMLSTIFREVPCYAGQFGAYCATKKMLANLKGVSENQLGPLDQLIAGGTGGLFCWLSSYPQDVIKTRLQVSRSGIYHKFMIGRFSIPDGGIISCSKAIYQAEGVRGFWQGFSACASRAVIANALMFVAYEHAQKKYRELNE